jgi:hypothetical protein
LREGITIDILKLLDQLEDLIDKHPFKLFHRAYGVDLDQFFTLTNRIRATLPEEVKRATQVSRDTERIIAAAKDEAQRITDRAERERAQTMREAQEQAALLVSNDEITRQAQEQAADILRRADQEAAEMRQEMDGYARQVLSGLEAYTRRVLAAVQKGKEKLEVPVPPQEGEGPRQEG